MTARELALAQPDLAPVPVEVPEWGGTVYVHPLNGHDLAKLFAGGEPDPVTLTILSVRGADGVPLFAADDALALARKPQFPFLRVAAAAIDLNRLNEGIAAAKKG